MPRSHEVDTSNLPESQVQNDEALESLGIVVGEIAHDFNNILSLIFGYVEMALSEIPEGQRARSDLEHVLAAGDRAKELVARILTFSNRAKLKHDEILIENPIEEAINHIRERLPTNVEFNSSIEHQEGKVLSNETEIYQVVTNLCTNSLQAIENDDGKIEVNLDYFSKSSDFAQQHTGLKACDYARITVKDNGCGMDMNTLEKMYNPFFTTARGDETNKNRAGLGLTTVYNIISSQDGIIFVNSEPGEGTTFEICLPLISSNIQSQDTYTLSPPQSINNKRILFIDDESAITEMANQILTQSGYSISTYNDGNEALEHFRQQPHEFDLIITDLIMPVMTGTELASKLTALNPNIPIILTTGFSEKITSASCDKWGIDRVINKPFAIHDLLSAIEELC